MKTYRVGIIAVAIPLVVTGVGFGIAQAGGTEWIVEALDAYFEYLPEDRPVLSFDDQELPQVAKTSAEDMQQESPIETGAIPVTAGRVSPV